MSHHLSVERVSEIAELPPSGYERYKNSETSTHLLTSHTFSFIYLKRKDDRGKLLIVEFL